MCLASYGQGQISRPTKKQSVKQGSVVNISAPDDYVNGHGYVDLGLQSGTLWATCNVGASTPTDLGEQYAWGENTTKSDFTEENSLTHNVFMNDYGGDPTRDAATSAWGNSWRTPNRADVEELINECQIESIVEKDLTGIKITGPNGKSIFLKGVGGFSNNTQFNTGNVEYWVSSPLDSDKSRGGFLLFYDNKNGLQSNRCYQRWYGLPVRPVIK